MNLDRHRRSGSALPRCRPKLRLIPNSNRPSGSQLRDIRISLPYHAGGIDRQAADVQGDLFLDDAFLGAPKCQVRVLRLGLVGQCGRFAPLYGGVATLDGGSTRAGHKRDRRESMGNEISSHIK